ncbi:hypothetical protein FRB95_007512 [Tulasnella sp. JGI-2019a]|nr:hypothetical protein FRB95_007512 [Tulasnella sp. JGI-2019a]
MMATNIVIVIHTFYVTAFIVGRLWWVGHEVDRFDSLEEAKRNRYRGAISAVAQSGVMSFAVTLVLIVGAGLKNIVMIVIVSHNTVPVNGIAATLLVLQLNAFQAQSHRNQGNQQPPLTTGTAFKFASRKTSPEWESVPNPVADASTSMGAYEYRSLTCPTVDEETSTPVRVALVQRETNHSDQSATPTIPPENGLGSITSLPPS